MSSRRCGLTLLAGLLISGAALLAPQGARANLSFTKQTGRGCDTCHAYGETPTKETVNQTGLNFYACKQDKGCILQWLAALPPETPPGRPVSQPPDPVPQPAPMPAPMPARTDADLPAGTYLHTCINSRIVDGVLSADCRRADQTLRSTSLTDPFGCSGQITNDDGRLHCAAGQQQVSGGAMWGAIAVADAKGDRPGQVDRWGAGRGATRQLAVADALARCQGNGYGGCDIKITYQGQCGAYASSKKHAGQGIGLSVAMASQAALDSCGKRSCRVAVTACASDQ